MKLRESEFQKESNRILHAENPHGLRLFRNQVGTVVPYRIAKEALMTHYSKGKNMIDRNIFTCGFGKGSSDRIGIVSVIITPEMVGRKIGRFVALEDKRENHKTDADHLVRQQNFRDMINSLGGAAGIVSTLEEANRVIYTI